MRYPCLVPKRLCKIDITPVSYTHLEKVELSKRMKPEAVDNLESTIRSLHKKYGIMPKAVIHSPLKVEDATATYNLSLIHIWQQMTQERRRRTSSTRILEYWMISEFWQSIRVMDPASTRCHILFSIHPAAIRSYL